MSTVRSTLVASLVFTACWPKPLDETEEINSSSSTSEPTTTGSGPTTLPATDATTETTAVETSTSTSEPMTSTTTEVPITCGDSKVEGDEECDDGSDNGVGQACKADCTLNICGDNDQGPGEECDDGQANSDTAACTLGCKAAVCGDSLILGGVGGEQCDDGNDVDTDDCIKGCLKASCGDGFIHKDVEDCEDGNEVDADACSHCFKPRMVFITSKPFKGDLGGMMGGVKGADDKCNDLALEAGLEGEFMAWISGETQESAPKFRFLSELFTGQYRAPGGSLQVIAQGWTKLVSDGLMNAIVLDESGVDQKINNVWTNTKADGSRTGDDHCANWSNAARIEGALGKSENGLVTGEWTQKVTMDTAECFAEARLYCFQVK